MTCQTSAKFFGRRRRGRLDILLRWKVSAGGFRLRRAVVRSGLDALYFSGLHRLFGGLWGGIGAILTLHHVRPARDAPFQPNRFLEVTPEFLDSALHALRRQGFELISLDEMHRRLQAGDFRRRFVCLTFDDGYRDNREWAYPILKRHAAPFAIYVPTSFPDRRGHLWWLTLETAVAANDHVALALDGGLRRFSCRSTAEKYATIEALHRALCALPSEEQVRTAVADLAARAGIDPAAECAALCMNWEELSALAADPLVTIGAHTVSHPRLCKTNAAEARREMAESAARIEAMLGARPAHFSYPFGDPSAAGPREFTLAHELGFKSAVTTRPGVLFPEHREYPTALPRISLNGEFQRLRYLKVLTSGSATALWNGFRRVDAA
jgi:peptidoglycan/xylan/chitin deacetylase (PgdA/CDA1 family)